jgi:hypothetical protein
MPESTIVAQLVTPAVGKEIVLTAAEAAGSKFLNAGKCQLVIYNGAGVTQTATVHAQKVCNYDYEHDMILAVPTLKYWISPVINPVIYNDDSGYTHITYSAVVTMTAGVMKYA